MTIPFQCTRPNCNLPAHATLAEAGEYKLLCAAHFEEATAHGMIVTGSNGWRYEVVADALDIELSEARRENARLRARVAELEGQGAK